MKTPPKPFCAGWMLLLSLMVSFSGLYGQEEERMRGIKKANTTEATLTTGRNFMFVIGIDAYENWLELRNAASDAKGIEEIFAEKFGFSPIVPALYNEEATKDKIMGSFDLIRQKLEPEDNLIVFYAGHGETRVDTVAGKMRESGFLIPVDGPNLTEGLFAPYISVEEFLKEIALLPARHSLVILDACHSGIAMGSSISGTRGSEKAPVTSLAASTSRRVISSARKDQLASDNGPLPNHSLFTSLLILGLENGAADIDGDGRVLTSEMGLYLSQAVRQASRDRQTPDFGTFALDERGEMVLDLEGNAPSILLANANAQLAAGKTPDFLRTMEKVMELENLPKNAYYLTFRAALILNRIDDAKESLQQRLDMENEFELEEGSMEQLAYQDLSRVKKFIDFWQPYLEVVDSSSSIRVELIHADTSVSFLTGSSNYGRFPLPTNARFRIRVTNLGDKPVYTHCLYFDPYGRGSQKILWEDLQVLSKGIQPGQSAVSHEITHSGTQGLKEYRLFFSGEQMLDFFKPVEDMAMESVGIPPEDLTIYALRLVFDRASRTY